MELANLNDAAQKAWNALVGCYPEFRDCFGTCGKDDLEVAIPAPQGSNAGHLVVYTNESDLWLRFSPPYMCYSLDNVDEMLDVVKMLLADEALFVVIMKGDKWAGTTLTTSGLAPELEPGQVVHVVSWTGACDRTVVAPHAI